MAGVFSSMLHVFLLFLNIFLPCRFFLARFIPQLWQMILISNNVQKGTAAILRSRTSIMWLNEGESNGGLTVGKQLSNFQPRWA